MACISSVSYSFQLNGQRFGHVTPSRGLRQGDPLSPYLFLLCGEGISSLLHHSEQSGFLQGLRCGLRGPTITHLLFADDSLFFLEAKTVACNALKDILTSYEAASRKMNKQGLFSSIKDRELHRLCAQFWWGGEPEKRRMHWCTWEKLCSHKFDGGMGFRDLRMFNRAILAKQAWRIHTHPTSLVARVLQGFYFHKSTFLQVKVNSSSSFVWRSILWGRELYKQGLRRKIGSGQDTYIYHDCWLPRDGVFKISSPRVLGNFDKVSSLISASGSWDTTLIRASFHMDEADAILSLPLPRRTTPDNLLWHYDKSGHYTVHSGYWLATKCRSVSLSSTLNINSWWKQFWKLRIPSKIKVFLRKAYHNWIPSSVNLAKHGVPTQLRCLFCNEADDTTLHALWGCKALNSLKKMCAPLTQF
ncbi:hypothetical protein UlMin_004007 [Ulmus minor]